MMALLVWGKLGSFIMITKQFGVYIRMIFMMLKVIVNFLIIWSAFVVCCSVIFCALFYKENPDFRNFGISFSTLLNASVTNFNLTNFSERTYDYGRTLFSLYIAISAIFLLNMLIAFLSNVYKDILDQIDADYNSNLILAYLK